MNIEQIKKNTDFKLMYYTKITSTHEFAKKNIEKLKNKTIIIAEKQTKGIGTKFKKWYTGENKNIAMSIILKPNVEVETLEGITIKIAEIIKDQIFKLYKIKLVIKYPNDLILNGKKISGILTQSNIIGKKVNFIIISIGFNVNEEKFDKEVELLATSLKKEYDRDFNREEIIIKILENIDNCVKKEVKNE